MRPSEVTARRTLADPVAASGAMAPTASVILKIESLGTVGTFRTVGPKRSPRRIEVVGASQRDFGKLGVLVLTAEGGEPDQRPVTSGR